MIAGQHSVAVDRHRAEEVAGSGRGAEEEHRSAARQLPRPRIGWWRWRRWVAGLCDDGRERAVQRVAELGALGRGRLDRLADPVDEVGAVVGSAIDADEIGD